MLSYEYKQPPPSYFLEEIKELYRFMDKMNDNPEDEKYKEYYELKKWAIEERKKAKETKVSNL